MSTVAKPRVFVGSSSEAEIVCRYLQIELERLVACEVTVWTQGAFLVGTYTLERLEQLARESDFAVLIATPDDIVQSRGVSQAVARDNVIFELGLFIGAIGRERTYIVAERGDKRLKLPSDLDGLTWLPYQGREDGNGHAAVAQAALGLADAIRKLGNRTHSDNP